MCRLTAFVFARSSDSDVTGVATAVNHKFQTFCKNAIAVFAAASSWQAAAQQPPPNRSLQAASDAYVAQAYRARCASCHGDTLTGSATRPAILSYIRYHTDAEVAPRIRSAHSGDAVAHISDEDLKPVLADLRKLAGTDPTMATGGFTGIRPGSPLPGAAPLPVIGGRTSFGDGHNRPVTVKLADGGQLSGSMLADSESDATVFAGGRFHLLSKEGDVYREKRIEPKLDWLTYHGSLAGGRYSPLEQISATTVQDLAPLWTFKAASPKLQATPVVVDGVMYITGWNEISTVDATTGRFLWSYSQPHTAGLLGDAGSGSNRGAAIAGDRVFMVTDNAHLLSFNRFTGEKQWDIEMANYKEGYSATVPALVVGDLLIQGMSGGDEGVRGFLDAYRISTGMRVWRFWTIPERGEKGSETWIGQAIDHGCGGTWQTGAYDATLDLIYWTTGNPCPDHNGEERLGDNLYTSSVVALAAKTGELKWYYQFSPHDTHDWDSTEPVVLVDEMWRGRPRKLLLHGDRNGMFYVLDRTNGEFLLGSNLSTKITWNHGFTEEGRPIVDPASVASKEGVALCPGPNGGAYWPEVSYSPIAKLFYARVTDGCGISTSSDDPLTNRRWFGLVKPDPPKAQAALAALIADYPGGSFIRAMDPFTGRKVWDFAVTAGRGCPLSTAGGLVFFGADGGLDALDAKTGKLIRHVDIGQNTLATPMTYMVGGEQYIALPGNGTVVAYALRR
jgi:alcohol dehydrogenase (cytochrome c)